MLNFIGLVVIKQEIRRYLKQFYSNNELKQYIDPLDLVFDKENKSIKIYFPHKLFYPWFKKNIGPLFEERLAAYDGGGQRIEYQTETNARPVKTAPTKKAAPASDYPFGQAYTFDSFIALGGSSLLLNTARQIALHDDAKFNPFIICGESGSGKSHLLRAMANELSRRHGPWSILFCTINELKSIYENKFNADRYVTRAYLDNFQFFFIENIHNISGHKNNQDDFIILMDRYLSMNRLMFFSTQENPSLSKNFSEQLKARLESGLILYAKKPDLQTKVAYINEQCQRLKINISKKNCLSLAGQANDIRSLQGSMAKIMAHKEILKEHITSDILEQIISEKKHMSARPAVQVKHIFTAVSEHYNIVKSELTGSKRNARIILPRQVAMYLCRDMIGCSYPELGRIFGGKDHSTVMHSVKKIMKLQEDDQETKNMVTILRNRCSYLAESGK